MTTARHAHSSSRYSASPKSLAIEVNRGASAEDPLANLMTFTEIGDPLRAAQVAADGWGRFVPDDKTDVGLMWRQERWAKVATATRKLTDKTWVVSGKTHRLVAAAATLEAQGEGYRIWVAVIHFPSGVEGDGGFATDNDDAVAAWKSGLNGLHDWWLDQKHQYEIGSTGGFGMLCADWNLNHRLKWVREYIGNTFDAMNSTWRSPYPDHGTYGKRIIDATWTTGAVARPAWLLKDDDSSDHRPYADVVTRRNQAEGEVAKRGTRFA